MAGGQPHDRAARQPCRGRVRLSCRRARLPAPRELNAPPADSAAGDDLFPGSCGVLWPASLRCCRTPPADLSQTALPPAGRPGVPAFAGSRDCPCPQSGPYLNQDRRLTAQPPAVAGKRLRMRDKTRPGLQRSLVSPGSESARMQPREKTVTQTIAKQVAATNGAAAASRRTPSRACSPPSRHVWPRGRCRTVC